MSEVKRFSLVKPTTHTPLHIDFDWFKESDNSWRVYLRGYLCPEHQKTFAETANNEKIDFVDVETAEVHTVDGLQHILMSHCAKQPEFITDNTAMVDAVFKVFLANGNQPLTAEQLAEIIHKPPMTILRTLTGPKVYKGLRPCPEP